MTTSRLSIRSDYARTTGGDCDDQMNEKDDDIAHPGNGINTSKTHDIQPNLIIRHDTMYTSKLLGQAKWKSQLV
jgi:hypothetical protein